MANVKQLFEFIDLAEKNRKYPQGTAVGRRAALRLFEAELNEEEKESLATFKSNLEQIYQNVFNKNKSKMSAESLITYKNRVEKLISDYESYGDSTKFTNWNRPLRKTRTAHLQSKEEVNNKNENTTLITEKGPEFSRFELPLRTGMKTIIIVPSDIRKSEVKKIQKYIEFLDSIAQPDSENTGD